MAYVSIRLDILEKGLAMNGKQIPLWARIAIVLVTLVTCFSIVGILKSGTSNTSSPSQAEITQEQTPAPTPEPTPAPEPEKPANQVFDTDFGTLEYHNIQDAVGNAVVGFMFTNKTDVTVSGYPENLVVNGQFNVQSLGGVQSVSGIGAGNSGAVAFTFGVPTQTTLESVSEITSISGDFRVYPVDSVTETIGYIHFDVLV